MKKPLRDWRMVAALGVLATGSAGYNVIRPWLAGSLTTAAAVVDEQIPMAETPSAFIVPADADQAVTSATRIRVTATENLPQFSAAAIQGRDPFATAQSMTSPRLLPTIDPAGGTAAVPHSGGPEVSAIVVTEHWRAAIIDGQFVAPGQRIGDRVVARIDADTVQLRGAEPETVSLAYLGAAP